MNGSSSSSSFEVLNGGSMSSGHSSPSAVVMAHLEVDSAVWLYMRKCPKYSGPLEQVTKDCRVSADLDVSGQAEIPDRLILTGDDKGEVDKAMEEIERMVEHCQQSVCVRKLPTQTDAVYQNVVQHVNDVVNGAQISLDGPANIRLIGTAVEVDDAMKRLREVCGVVEDDCQVVEGQEQGAAAGHSRAASRNVQIMKLETDLWKYMQKNPEFADDVRRLKEEMHVDVVEAVSDGQQSEAEVELVFSGPDDDVTAAMDRSILLTSRCRATTTIKSFPCQDNRVFARIVRLLPTINKNQGHVSAADGVVSVTGNEEEQAVCRDRLVKVGLVIEDQPKHSTGVVTVSDVPPPPPPPVAVPPSVAEAGAPARAEVPPTAIDPTQVPRPFDRAELQPPLPDLPTDNATAAAAAAAADQQRTVDPFSAAGDGWRREQEDASATSAELPVPIEAPLWAFIEKRRRQQLQELHDVYGVSVQSYQSDDGMVRIRLDATSPDMLACGQDALGQLIDQLNKSVTIVPMETSASEDLPREAALVFQQLAEDTDAIIEVAGSRIIFIGSSDGIAACQQKIVQLQAQQMQDNPQLMTRMQQRMMAAGRAGVDGDTMTRNMQNQLMTGGGAGLMGMMGAMPGMSRGPGGLMGRLGGGRGGPGLGGSMTGDLGGLTGLPPGMLGGRPGGPLGIPGDEPRGLDAGLRPPPMTGPGEASLPNMMGGGGMCGVRGPPDVMRPPMGPSPDVMRPPMGPTTDVMRPPMGPSPDVMRPPMGPTTASTEVTPPTSTASATDLLSGRPGGMVGSLATTPGSVILGQSQPKKSADDLPQPAPLPPPSGTGPPLPTTKKPEPLPPPRMPDDDEERGTLPQGGGTLSTSKKLERDESPAVAAERPSEPEPTRTESRYGGHDRDDKSTAAAAAEATADGEPCTACEAGGLEYRATDKKCPHAFCVSCIQAYFSHGETECPVCGVKDEVSGRTLTQPATGNMLTTYDNCFKLPGFEATSRGTIIVTYSFPAGTQTDDMPNPGRKYSSTTKTAFFPMSTEGVQLVDKLQRAFTARLLFTVNSAADGSDDELVWNGVCHKTNVFGGPQQSGYPDPVYLRRVRSELDSKGLK